MNVAELIEKLSKLDPNLEVVYEDETAFYPITQLIEKDLWVQGPYASSFWYYPWDTGTEKRRVLVAE